MLLILSVCSSLRIFTAGLEICLWGEMVRIMDQVEYMLYPRLLAAAERAWHVADWEVLPVNSSDFKRRLGIDWRRFALAVGHRELRRLERLDVHYRLPPPGIRFAVHRHHLTLKVLR
jgi:hexosaminidase